MAAVEAVERLKQGWYGVCRIVCTTGFTFTHSYRMTGGQHMPARGPVLLIANHQSYLDPVLVGVASPRQLVFLARQTLFRGPFQYLIRSLNAVPIDQESGGKEGLQTVLGQLAAGKAVLIFPEGTRTLDGQLQPLEPGITLLSKRAPCPIVPVGIAGAFAAWPRTHQWPQMAPLLAPPQPGTIAVALGKPIQPTALTGLSRAQQLAMLHAAMSVEFGRAQRLQRR
jgi:1-acyl-sn-glycerol-3-phosphate acyltransferase